MTVTIPGQPGEEAFEAAYSAALNGKPKPVEVVRHPKAALPRTLKAAWHLPTQTPEWKALRQSTKDQYIAQAERLLTMPAIAGGTLTFTDVIVGELKRRHVKDLLGRMSDRPHSAADCLIMLRKDDRGRVGRRVDTAQSNAQTAICTQDHRPPCLDR